MNPKTGIELISDERKRQIGVENYNAAHDDAHTDGEIALAAAVYALPARVRALKSLNTAIEWFLWPWDRDCWKPTPDDRVLELVKAGALLAAEIDRLQRAQVTTLDQFLERHQLGLLEDWIVKDGEPIRRVRIPHSEVKDDAKALTIRSAFGVGKTYQEAFDDYEWAINGKWLVIFPESEKANRRELQVPVFTISATPDGATVRTMHLPRSAAR
jgi:hypothetical protein